MEDGADQLGKPWDFLIDALWIDSDIDQGKGERFFLRNLFRSKPRDERFVFQLIGWILDGV